LSTLPSNSMTGEGAAQNFRFDHLPQPLGEAVDQTVPFRIPLTELYVAHVRLPPPTFFVFSTCKQDAKAYPHKPRLYSFRRKGVVFAPPIPITIG